MGPPRQSTVHSFHEDPLLDAVVGQLVAARGAPFDLFDEAFARTVDWVDTAGGLCRVTPSQVGLRRDHPLVERARQRMDDTSIAFLSSVVFSSVNRALVDVVDHDELDLQRGFLASVRARKRDA